VREHERQEGNMDSTTTASPFARRIAVGFSVALFGIVLAASTLGGLNAGANDDLAAGKVRRMSPEHPVVVTPPRATPGPVATPPVVTTPAQTGTTPVGTPVGTPAPVEPGVTPVKPGNGPVPHAGKVR
jgi:hypothetical protein